MKAIICAGLMALTITAANSAEDYDTANHRLFSCKAILTLKDDAPAMTFYKGMCLGEVTSLATLAANSTVSPSAFSGAGKERAVIEHWRCVRPPDGVSDDETLNVVVRYIEARPERMNEPFLSLALEALFDAWACKD